MIDKICEHCAKAYTPPIAELCKHVYRNFEGDAVYCNATRDLHYASDHHFTAASE